MLGRVIVQVIDISWSKASRGGAGAQTRARLPRGHVLPIEVLESKKKFEIHALKCSEGDGFAPAAQQNIWSDGRMVPCNIRCARILPKEDEVEVRFEYNENNGGQPFRSFIAPATGERTPFSKSICQLGPGQWGRLRWNGRFTNEETGWWYEEHCINVGFFTQQPRLDVFTMIPTQGYENLATLW